MTVNEILNKIASGKATVKVVDNMLEVKVKQYDKETGTLGNPIKEYLSISELQQTKNRFENKASKIDQLLALVNL